MRSILRTNPILNSLKEAGWFWVMIWLIDLIAIIAFIILPMFDNYSVFFWIMDATCGACK